MRKIEHFDWRGGSVDALQNISQRIFSLDFRLNLLEERIGLGS